MFTPSRTRIAVGAALALALWFYPDAWRYAAPALSPFIAISSAMATRTLGWTLLLALPMLAVVALRKRFWCRRMCPVGLISETCGHMSKRAPVGGEPVGRYLVLATLAGALLGYPLFLWMDPLALFGAFFNFARPALIGLVLMMAVSWRWPGMWCGRLCPLGATQDLIVLRARGFSNGRRAALAGLGGVAIGAIVAKLMVRVRPMLRPPGAVVEAAFEGGCIRCGSCVRVCPTGIIQPTLNPVNPAAWLAPHVEFAGNNYCKQDCNRCGRVCPSGVIRPLPLAAKNAHVIGIAKVNLATCYLTIEKECGVCVARCPRQAIVDTFNYERYQSVIAVVADRCNGCGACVGICPPKAILIEPLTVKSNRV